MSNDGTLKVEAKGDREIMMTRVFNAPRNLVYDAFTKPELLKRWLGVFGGWTLPVCEIDLRPGGAWRYVVRDKETGREDAFSGVYREIAPPDHVVYSEGWEAMPGHDYLVTATFTEDGGKTTITSRLQYKSREDRDGHVQSGMEAGMRETYERLGEHLATMA